MIYVVRGYLCLTQSSQSSQRFFLCGHGVRIFSIHHREHRGTRRIQLEFLSENMVNSSWTQV